MHPFIRATSADTNRRRRARSLRRTFALVSIAVGLALLASVGLTWSFASAASGGKGQATEVEEKDPKVEEKDPKKDPKVEEKDPEDADRDDKKVWICHEAGQKGKQISLYVSVNGKNGHFDNNGNLHQGDTLGKCADDGGTTEDPDVVVCRDGVNTPVKQDDLASGETAGACPVVTNVTVCRNGANVTVKQNELAPGETAGACPAVDPDVTICRDGATLTVKQSVVLASDTAGSCPAGSNSTAPGSSDTGGGTTGGDTTSTGSSTPSGNGGTVIAPGAAEAGVETTAGAEAGGEAAAGATAGEAAGATDTAGAADAAGAADVADAGSGDAEVLGAADGAAIAPVDAGGSSTGAGATGELPFTGLSLNQVALLGAGLLMVGLGLATGISPARPVRDAAA